MMTTRFSVALLFAAAAASLAGAPAAAHWGGAVGGAGRVAQNVATLPSPLPPHPRLIATPAKIAALASTLSSDPEAAYHFQQLVELGQSILTQAPVTQPAPGPSGILTTCRTVVHRVLTLGLLHLLRASNNTLPAVAASAATVAPSAASAAPAATDSPGGGGGGSSNVTIWSDRAVVEMAAFANFTTWNPPHFLDVAEGSFAVAIGLDWLDDALTPAQRQAFEDVLAAYGLDQGAAVFNGTSPYAAGALIRFPILINHDGSMLKQKLHCCAEGQ
jgi:hypothetical protein